MSSDPFGVARACAALSSRFPIGRVVVVGVMLGLVAGTAAEVSGQPAPADEASRIREEVVRLREEFESLRDGYDARLAALEARLTALEQAPASPGPEPDPAGPPPPAAPAPVAETPDPVAEAPVPAGAGGAGGPAGALPLYGGPSALSKIFNPDIAVIGNFIAAAGRDEFSERPALELHEVEASFQAVVDPYARADFFVAFGHDEVELEEGYLTLTALPGGVLTKVGKMKAQFGKTNTLHPHQLPWVDQPLVVQNLLGGDEGLVDAGVSVSKLILNPWVFLEATGEVYAGHNSLFHADERSDLMWLGRLRAYRDVTESTNVDVGASAAFGANDFGEDGRTRLFGVDATFRYRPLRRATSRRLLARSEWMWNRASFDGTGETAFGMYAGGEYQFSRRWFAGGRYDYAERAFAPSLADRSGSLLVTFWPSEFSQVRGQFRRTRYAEGLTGNEFLFQFLFSIGAHGAHTF